MDDVLRLTSQERLVIARSLEITAALQDSLDWPREADACRELRTRVLGNLTLEADAA